MPIIDKIGRILQNLFWQIEHRVFDPDKGKELRPEFIEELKRREAAHDEQQEAYDNG